MALELSTAARRQNRWNPVDRRRWFSVLECRTTDGNSVGLRTDITDQKRQTEPGSRSQLEQQAAQLAKLAERLELAKRDADRNTYLAERADGENQLPRQHVARLRRRSTPSSASPAVRADPSVSQPAEICDYVRIGGDMASIRCR
jgi:hypothetical protein